MSNSSESTSNRELVFLHFGPFSNLMGSYFWNMQDEQVAYWDSPNVKDEIFPGTYLHNIRSGATSVWTPRALFFDMESQYIPKPQKSDSSSSSSSSTEASSQENNPNTNIWKGTIQTETTDFDTRFRSINSNPVAISSSKSPVSTPPENQPKNPIIVENNWSSNHQMNLSQKSLCLLNDHQFSGDHPFDQFNHGYQIFSNSYRDDILDEHLRPQLENSKNPQGFVNFVDSNSGWAGLSHKFVVSVRDYMGKTSVATIGSVPPRAFQESQIANNAHPSTISSLGISDSEFGRNRPDLQWARHILNTGLATSTLSEVSDMFIPLCFDKFSSQSIENPNFNDSIGPPFTNNSMEYIWSINDIRNATFAASFGAAAIDSAFMPLHSISPGKYHLLHRYISNLSTTSQNLVIASLGSGLPLPLRTLSTQSLNRGPTRNTYSALQLVDPASIAILLGYSGPNINLARWSGGHNLLNNQDLHYSNKTIRHNAVSMMNYFFAGGGRGLSNAPHEESIVEKLDPKLAYQFFSFDDKYKNLLQGRKKPLPIAEKLKFDATILPPRLLSMYNSLIILSGKAQAEKTMYPMFLNHLKQNPNLAPGQKFSQQQTTPQFKHSVANFDLPYTDPSWMVSLTPGVGYGTQCLPRDYAKKVYGFDKSLNKTDLVRYAKSIGEKSSSFSQVIVFRGIPINSPITTLSQDSLARNLPEYMKNGQTPRHIIDSYMKNSHADARAALTSSHYMYNQVVPIPSKFPKMFKSTRVTKFGLTTPVSSATPSSDHGLISAPAIGHIQETHQVHKHLEALRVEFSNQTTKRYNMHKTLGYNQNLDPEDFGDNEQLSKVTAMYQ